jgi:hypothetical protein
LSGPSDKLTHARKLFDALRELMANLPQPRAAARQTEGLVEIAWTLEPPPEIPLWHCLVGDIVHNLRASLDHLACLLVRANGGKVERKTCFVISDSEAAFNKAVGDALLGATKQAQDAVRLLKPYAGGSTRLHQLHALDIADKHHGILITPVSAGMLSFNFGEGARPGFRIALAFQQEPVMGQDVLIVLAEMHDAVADAWEALSAHYQQQPIQPNSGG